MKGPQEHKATECNYSTRNFYTGSFDTKYKEKSQFLIQNTLEKSSTLWKITFFGSSSTCANIYFGPESNSNNADLANLYHRRTFVQ